MRNRARPQQARTPFGRYGVAWLSGPGYARPLGATPHTYSATGLPAGPTISTSGLISGTARSPGTKTVTVTGESAAGAFTTITFIWTVS